jgi:hypothetical protein
MSDDRQVIERLYTAFQSHDGLAMAACYHPEATFSDPVFVDLKGKEVGAMWRMLCERGKDLSLVFQVLSAEGGRAKAHWEADYSFSKTGRKVHNVIDAEFELKDGLILHHQDHFSLWRWSRMALGPVGLFTGWMSLFQTKLRQEAKRGLLAYMAKQGI